MSDAEKHVENADQIAQRVHNLSSITNDPPDLIIRQLAEQIRSELHKALEIIRRNR